ncbi:MAG: hypothetical protein U0470_06690 [Anaerolineae bacterium]
MFKRIADFFRMLFSIFIDRAEDSVPLERRLAYDRVNRAENLKKQMGAAEDVGAAAEMMVQQLAEARVVSANLRHEAKQHLQLAAAAAAKGDTSTAEAEEARATSMAEELAQAEAEVGDLEQLVADALQDKKEAINMILDQAKELEKLARNDTRLIARARMTGMRRQQLELREQMMDLVPNDQSNIRARAQEKLQSDEARYRSRKDVVDALWEQKRRATTDRMMTTSAAGAAKLEELKAELGYTTAAPATAPSIEAPAEMEAGAEPGADPGASQRSNS